MSSPKSLQHHRMFRVPHGTSGRELPFPTIGILQIARYGPTCLLGYVSLGTLGGNASSNGAPDKVRFGL